MSLRNSASDNTVPLTMYERRSVPPMRPGFHGRAAAQTLVYHLPDFLTVDDTGVLDRPARGDGCEPIRLIDAAPIGPFPLMTVARRIDVRPQFIGAAGQWWVNRLRPDSERVSAVVQMHVEQFH
jgi:hypothetical protein